MKVILLCGSRSWTDVAAVRKRMVEEGPDTVWILGGAKRGADYIAEMNCVECALFHGVFPAPWPRGRQAGFERNSAMLAVDPDRVIAFWDGRSNGTRDTITKAEALGIEVEVITPDRAPA